LRVGNGEMERRIASTVHLAFLSSVGVFGLILWVARRNGAATLDTSGRNGTATGLMLFLGIAEVAWAGWFGRRVLLRRSGDALARVRSCFFLRFAAAEAVGVFGLMAGFLGASAVTIGLFLAISVASLAAAAPSREAWQSALDTASGPAGPLP
jgi:hypothetical protein